MKNYIFSGICIIVGMVLGIFAVAILFGGRFDTSCNICLVVGAVTGAFFGSVASMGLKKSIYFFSGLILGAFFGAIVGLCIDMIIHILEILGSSHLIPMHGEADGWGTLGVMIFMPIFGAVSGVLCTALGMIRSPFPRSFTWLEGKICASYIGVVILMPLIIILASQLNLLRAVYLSSAMMIAISAAGLLGRLIGRSWKSHLGPILLE